MRPYLKFLLLATLLPCIQSCKHDIKTPEFLGVDGVKVHSLGFTESQLRMNLRFQNPNSFPIELRKADIDLSIDDRPLGKTILDTIIMIPARDSFYVPIKMDVEMKSLFPNLLAVALKEDFELGMEGHVRIRRSGINLNIPVHYRGKQKIFGRP
jgi:LEA14-like dessication related protein